MKTTMENTATSSPGLETRFALVRAFLRDRRATNYFSAFAAANLTFSEDDEERVRNLWNSRVSVCPDDEPLIARMERVVEFLKSAA